MLTYKPCAIYMFCKIYKYYEGGILNQIRKIDEDIKTVHCISLLQLEQRCTSVIDDLHLHVQQYDLVAIELKFCVQRFVDNA